MYKVLKLIFFRFNPEVIHNFVICFASGMKFLYPVFKWMYSPSIREITKIKDLNFINNIGLAAGLDKDAEAICFWEALGFSHIEVGTVTPFPQPGNDKPRLFRLVKDKALLNRMGFNNKGADVIKENIIKAKNRIKNQDFVIGVNIGKNKNTPLEKAKDDYKTCIEKLSDVADYFTVNISSPNTEGLRDLQGKEYLDELLKEISKSVNEKPVFLKIAPDLSNEEIILTYNTALKYNFTGIVATNTTINKKNLSISENEVFDKYGKLGGISGKPLKLKADDVLGLLNKLNSLNNNIMILIASGGVSSKEDYLSKLKLGATLVQVYTGFIYEGPGIIKKLYL